MQGAAEREGLAQQRGGGAVGGERGVPGFPQQQLGRGPLGQQGRHRADGRRAVGGARAGPEPRAVQPQRAEQGAQHDVPGVLAGPGPAAAPAVPPGDGGGTGLGGDQVVLYPGQHLVRLGQGQPRGGHGQVVPRDRGDLLGGRRRAVLGVDDDLNGDLHCCLPSLTDSGVDVQGVQGAVERGAVELVEAGQLQQPGQLIALVADGLAGGSVAVGAGCRRGSPPSGRR